MRTGRGRVVDGRRRRIDPSNYFDAGEVSILRAYFGLPLRKSDPPLESLYEGEREIDEADDDEEITGPIRLWRHAGDSGPINGLSNAVARICLTDAQDRLPQWAAVGAGGNAVLGRPRFERAHRMLPLEPQRLLCINWADSGPGFSWPEDYYATLLPRFDRYVVTASSDSTDSYGMTDFAIGGFPADEGITSGGRRVLLEWWRYARSVGQDAWAYVFDEGLIVRKSAVDMRDAVWARDAQ